MSQNNRVRRAWTTGACTVSMGPNKGKKSSSRLDHSAVSMGRRKSTKSSSHLDNGTVSMGRSKMALLYLLIGPTSQYVTVTPASWPTPPVRHGHAQWMSRLSGYPPPPPGVTRDIFGGLSLRGLGKKLLGVLWFKSPWIKKALTPPVRAHWTKIGWICALSQKQCCGCRDCGEMKLCRKLWILPPIHEQQLKSIRICCLPNKNVLVSLKTWSSLSIYACIKMWTTTYVYERQLTSVCICYRTRCILFAFLWRSLRIATCTVAFVIILWKMIQSSTHLLPWLGKVRLTANSALR